MENQNSTASFEDIVVRCLQASSDLSRQQLVDAHLDTALQRSIYISKILSRRPSLAGELIQAINKPRSAEKIRQMLEQQGESVDDEASLMVWLREFRAACQCRMIWRDVTGQASLQETVRELSDTADQIIDYTLTKLYTWSCNDIGTPVSEMTGEPQKMIVIGMGKLGAQELNLSSDVDLIFAYPEKGETQGGRRALSNQQFFIKVAQRLIKVLDTQTAEGFVFRIDMRLRPYGSEGALVSNFDALANYYHDQGRDWERYAMVKARAIAGDLVAGQRLMQELVPFVYRKYLDFSAVDSLREMKSKIRAEVKRRRLHNDVKLGEGGIREAEFIVQVFQLIYGGRNSDLRSRNFAQTVADLCQADLLPEQDGMALASAYEFLRRSEHAIQSWRDEQTQALPTEHDAQLALAHIFGCDTFEEYLILLNEHRLEVSSQFNQLISPVEESEETEELGGQNIWQAVLNDEPELLEIMQRHGFSNAAECAAPLLKLAGNSKVKVLQREGQERLNQFMPLLIEAASESTNKLSLLERILPLVESIIRRSAYLVLLIENAHARKQLFILAAASPWIAQHIARNPILLEELLNTQHLYTVPDKADLVVQLQQQTLRLNSDDLEAHMDELRYFRLAHVLRIAASEATGRLPLMKVSDYLTQLAEVILQYVLQLAWQDLASKHGNPINRDGSECVGEFLIVGYGKLGGWEMGHSSDLDLVFAHDADNQAMTNGGRAIAGQTFFVRLGQRIIHMLSCATHMGALYEVDMRLRPSGNSGLLVSTMSAFERYQQSEAWTWEHQSLVRARPVAGSPKLAEHFNQIRANILCQKREASTLAVEVEEMRDKMSAHLLPESAKGEQPEHFHLKHSRGGIVDIEFMVQFAVLAWAENNPALATWTDNIRILDSLQKAELITADQVAALSDAYKSYREQIHALALQSEKPLVSSNSYAEQRQQVVAIWQSLIGSAKA